MIDLSNIPRTDAEASAAFKLYCAAKLGKELHEIFNTGLTSDAWHFFAETEEFAAENNLSELREKVIDEHTTLCKICRKYEERLREDFMHAIDEYIAAAKKVEADTRSRDEILISEGWQPNSTGHWMRKTDRGDAA